jgi:hypothetical protein
MNTARDKAINVLAHALGGPITGRALEALDNAGLVFVDPAEFGDIVEERLARAGNWRAELETAECGDDPVRATLADGTEARDLNMGRFGMCGPEAMQRAIDREEEQ